MGGDELLDRALSIRVSEDDVARLDALAERITFASRNGLARHALRLGLAQIEADPASLLTSAPARPKRGRGRKG